MHRQWDYVVTRDAGVPGRMRASVGCAAAGAATAAMPELAMPELAVAALAGAGLVVAALATGAPVFGLGSVTYLVGSFMRP